MLRRQASDLASGAASPAIFAIPTGDTFAQELFSKFCVIRNTLIGMESLLKKVRDDDAWGQRMGIFLSSAM